MNPNPIAPGEELIVLPGSRNFPAGTRVKALSEPRAFCNPLKESVLCWDRKKHAGWVRVYLLAPAAGLPPVDPIQEEI